MQEGAKKKPGMYEHLEEKTSGQEPDRWREKGSDNLNKMTYWKMVQ